MGFILHRNQHHRIYSAEMGVVECRLNVEFAAVLRCDFENEMRIIFLQRSPEEMAVLCKGGRSAAAHIRAVLAYKAIVVFGYRYYPRVVFGKESRCGIGKFFCCGINIFRTCIGCGVNLLGFLECGLYSGVVTGMIAGISTYAG